MNINPDGFDFNIKGKTIKLLGNIIGTYLQDPRAEKDFLNQTQNVQTKRQCHVIDGLGLCRLGAAWAPTSQESLRPPRSRLGTRASGSHVNCVLCQVIVKVITFVL